MSFRLWSDEIEAMRAEARETVENMGAVMPRPEITPGMTRDERIAAQRASHVIPPEFMVDTAIPREIAGVPCRVIAADNPRAIYLHFHGGGMVAGSPEMMDIPNASLVPSRLTAGPMPLRNAELAPRWTDEPHGARILLTVTSWSRNAGIR